MRKFYEDNGCKLLSDKYITKKNKYKFICKCGKKGEKSFDSFYNGKRQCKECGYKSSSKKQTSIEEDDALKLISSIGGLFLNFYRTDKRYGKTQPFVKYICRNGHYNDVYYHSIKGHECKWCASIKARERYQKSIGEVRLELESYGLTLTSDKYVNMDLPIDFICSCGTPHQSTLGNIRKGVRCGCGYLKGEDSPLYNHNLTQEEREQKRNYPEYREWVKKVYERDNYTCSKCGEYGGELNAHHIKSYRDFKYDRVKVDNGATLCYDCHKFFHDTYGYIGFTDKDFYEYTNK